MTVTTLLFNGVNLRDVAIINDISGVYAPMTRRGNFDTIPGRDGQLGASLPFDAYQFSIPVTIGADTEAEMHTMLATFGASLLGNGGTGLGTLTRRLASDEAGGYVETTAAGACGGLTQITRVDDQTVLCSVLFTNLDGGWKRTSDNVWVRP